MLIPIVSARYEIVGWTGDPPRAIGPTLRHPEAERLVGSEIRCIYVELDDPDHVKKAGAPPDWAGAWRCLAICSERVGPRAAAGGASPIIAIAAGRAGA